MNFIKTLPYFERYLKQASYISFKVINKTLKNICLSNTTKYFSLVELWPTANMHKILDDKTH